MEGDKHDYEVPRELTADEVEKRKNELVKVDRKIDEVKSEKARANIEFNEELRPLEKRRKELLEAIHTSAETIMVKAVEEWDYKNKLVLFKHGGQVIDSVPMDKTQLQEDISNVQGGKNTKKKAKKK